MLKIARHLLSIVEKSFVQRSDRPEDDKKVLNNEFAELIYNDLTGLTAALIKEAFEKGNSEEANQLGSRLDDLWVTCVKLSLDPQAMQARCDNKKTFVLDLSKEQIVALRTSALMGHLSLPPERQNSLLITLAKSNLAYALFELGKVEEARVLIDEALLAVGKSSQEGDENVQFAGVKAVAKLIEAAVTETPTDTPTADSK